MPWDQHAQPIRVRAISKGGKVVKLRKWILRKGISTGLRDSLKSLPRKEIKGQIGAQRQPGVLAGKKFPKALALLSFTKKRCRRVEFSPVSNPGLYRNGDTQLKWLRKCTTDSFPGRTTQKPEKRVQGSQEIWSRRWDITFQGAQEESKGKCCPFISWKRRGRGDRCPSPQCCIWKAHLVCEVAWKWELRMGFP